VHIELDHLLFFELQPGDFGEDVHPLFGSGAKSQDHFGIEIVDGFFGRRGEDLVKLIDDDQRFGDTDGIAQGTFDRLVPHPLHKVHIGILFYNLFVQIVAVVRREKPFIAAAILKDFEGFFVVGAADGLDHHKEDHQIVGDVVGGELLTLFEDDRLAAA